MTRQARPGTSSFVYLFFVLSGAAGLVYEVVWARHLMLFMGVSTYAHTAVLATFMGGMALGAWGFGRLAERSRHGFRLYGWLEVAIGTYAALSPTLFEGLGALYVRGAQAVYPSPGALTAARFLLCVAVLLPPAVMMGGTLPVLTHFLTRQHSALRRHLGGLYSANSGGAVLGSFLAGFALIEVLGLTSTLVAVGTANVLLGLLAVLLSHLLPARGDAPPEEAGASPDTTLYGPADVRAAMAAAGLSGALTMGLEVVWLRYWGLVFGSATYTFSLVLMAFITGIALGSLVVAGRLGRRPLAPLLFWAFLATGLLLAAGLPFYDRVPYYFARLRLLFSNRPESYLAFQGLQYLGCLLLMLVPTVVSGMVLPAAVRIVSANAERVGRDVGRTWAVNTLGTLLGSTLTGLVLLSLLGLEGSFRLLLLGYLAAAAVVAVLRRRPALLAFPVGLAALHLATFAPWNQVVLNYGLYRQAQASLVQTAGTWSALVQGFERSGIRLEETYEGHSATVAVFAQGAARAMHINGKSDAGSGDDVTQRLIGHLPMLTARDPRRVLVVGLGSGGTAAAVRVHRPERIDVVELHPEVVEASQRFADYHDHVLDDPSVHLYVDDGLHFLRVTRGSYDVIASEPTNPWQTGVGNLFSQEYYRLAAQRLAPGGVLCQFLPGYEISDEVYYLLLRTALSEFPYVEVFQLQSLDTVLLASREPIVPGREELLRRAAGLGRLGLAGEPGLAALAYLHQTSAQDLPRMLAPGPLNSLDLPLAEFRAPEAFFLRTRPEAPRLLDTRAFWVRSPSLWWTRLVGDRPASSEELEALRGLAARGRNRALQQQLQRLAVASARSWEQLPAEALAAWWTTPPPGETCRELLAEGAAPSVAQLEAGYGVEREQVVQATTLLGRPDPSCVRALADRLLATDPATPGRRREAGIWAWAAGEVPTALRLLEDWARTELRPPGAAEDRLALRLLIRAKLSLGDRQGLRELSAALASPDRTPEDTLLVSEVVAGLAGPR